MWENFSKDEFKHYLTDVKGGGNVKVEPTQNNVNIQVHCTCNCTVQVVSQPCPIHGTGAGN
jgi:hypothetical protein